MTGKESRRELHHRSLEYRGVRTCVKPCRVVLTAGQEPASGNEDMRMSWLPILAWQGYVVVLLTPLNLEFLTSEMGTLFTGWNNCTDQVRPFKDVKVF